MTQSDIKAAVSEAIRFIARADEVLELMEAYKNRKGEDAPDSGYWPMQSGVLKRASLDLTRSLAKMRRRAGWKSVFDEMQEDAK